MMDWLEAVKPTDDELEHLALRETDPAEFERFQPIARGPLFAVAGLSLVGLLALPAIFWRLLRGWLRRPRESA